MYPSPIILPHFFNCRAWVCTQARDQRLKLAFIYRAGTLGIIGCNRQSPEVIIIDECHWDCNRVATISLAAVVHTLQGNPDERRLHPFLEYHDVHTICATQAVQEGRVDPIPVSPHEVEVLAEALT